VFAAILFGKKLYIHEQNAKTGSLNRISKPFARRFFSSFDPDSPCPDYPVEQKFYKTRRIRTKTDTILFMGGSLGAKAINDLAMGVSAELIARGKTIIHLTGKKDFERVNTFYQTNRLAVTCIPFDRAIDHLISQADFAVSRAGASSLFELYANAVPTLFVPYPHAASDHQYHNAMYLVDRGMAYCRRENELSRDYLLALLSQDHTEQSRKMHEMFGPNGAACITNALLS
jgi:UDP-N-acetylglucosamine--N-acetylmuramyl-(pentapeptide) pyrophosphoryl-undecaprenol N-acetylglucosamine transferase